MFPVASEGCWSHRASAEVGWAFASQHFSNQAEKSKHHISGPSGKQNMESATGNLPEILD